MAQRRTPGRVDVYDLWRKSDGTPSKRDGVGKRWRVAWIDYDAKQKTESFDRKVDAKKREKELITDLTRGAYIDPHRSRTTVDALYAAWEPTTVIKASTRVSRRSRWEKHVAPYWDGREVGTIRKTDVQAWISKLADAGAKPTTIDQALTLLRLVLEYAVDDGKLAANPAHGVKKPKIQQKPHKYLTVDQVRLLAGEVEDNYGNVVLLLAYSGLRFGEMSALRVGDVDLDRRRLRVHRSNTTAGGVLVEGTPKTHQSREVPIVKALKDILKTATTDRGADEYLFTAPAGGVLRVDNFRPRFFNPARDRAQKIDPTLPTVTVHDLRHTAASLAVASGANVKAVQRMLGHASAAMTLDRYSDLFDDDLDALLVKMDALIDGE